MWIAHEGPIDIATGAAGSAGEGALSKLRIDSAVVGQIPLVPGQPPQLRAMELEVVVSIGEDELTGVPVDIAFDDLQNLGALPGFASPFGAGAPAAINGKGAVREIASGLIANTSEAAFLFAAVPRPTQGVEGRVDVLALATALRIDTNAHQAGVQSIPAPAVAVLMDYFRQ